MQLYTIVVNTEGNKENIDLKNSDICKNQNQLLILHNKPNTVIMIKSRRLKRAGQVARMEEGRSAFKSFNM